MEITHYYQYAPLLRLVLHHMITRTAVNMSYKILGDGLEDATATPLLIFHGVIGRKRHWEGIGRTICNITKQPVIVADLRNHGDSPRSSSHKYTDLAEDILLLLNKLEVKRASMLGHSMGGRAIMATSLIAPEKVAGIVVVDISPVSSCTFLTKVMPNFIDAMSKVDFKGAKDVKQIRKSVTEQLRPHISDDQIMHAILSNVSMKSNGSIGYSVNLEAIIKNFKYIASFPSELKEKRYDGPTLFIGGQLSDFIRPDDLPEIRDIFPQAVITYVKGAKHNVHIDDPKAFLELTLNFLRGIK